MWHEVRPRIRAANAIREKLAIDKEERRLTAQLVELRATARELRKQGFPVDEAQIDEVEAKARQEFDAARLEVEGRAGEISTN
jgi:hypothetical protein